MASHAGHAAARSCSIWSIRITELRWIMPMRRDHPQQRHKTKGPIEQQQRRRTPANAQRPGQEHQHRARLKLCSCSISSVKVMNSMMGSPPRWTPSPGAFLHGARHLDAVARLACRPPLASSWRRRQQRRRHRGALQALGHVALHGDGVSRFSRHITPAPGEHRLGDLRQRNRLPDAVGR